MNNIDFKDFQLKENLDMPLKKLLDFWDKLKAEFDKNHYIWDRFPAAPGGENIITFIKTYKKTLLQMNPVFFTTCRATVVFHGQFHDPSSQKWYFGDYSYKEFKRFLQSKGLPISGNTLATLVPITHLFCSEEHLKFYDEYIEKQQLEEEAYMKYAKSKRIAHRKSLKDSLNIFINK